ncbi:MAG: DNA polymerase III subunit gamma/tau [Candidatus Humimicrobiaceae bacterium]
MGYISIYRKWRPQNFSEIVGQEDVVKPLKNALRTGRLSHAYLFCGPRGTGKTSTARILAKAINCQNRETGTNNAEPCNTCDNCISITNGSSVDVIEIDAASNRQVGPARELIERVNYLPNYLKKKVYIIDEVHMLTDAAFNTLLKTLEEPPEHVIFILATTEPDKVIPTIISRCQRYNFKPITSDSITGKLKTIASAENIDINDAALSLIAKHSGGSQRDANVILEKLASIDEKKIKVEDVASLLGAVDFEILFELTNILIEKNISDALFFEHRLKESYQNLRMFVEEFINHLQTLFIIKNYASSFEILNINAEHKEKYLDQSKLISNDSLQFYIELFSDLYKEIRISEGSGLLFRSALISAVMNNGYKAENIENSTINDLKNKILSFNKELENVNSAVLRIQTNVDGILSKVKNKPEAAEDTQSKKSNLLSGQEKITEKKEITEIKDNPEKQNVIMADINTETDINIEKAVKPADKTEASLSGSFVDEIKSNWDKICIAIKSKERGTALCALFIEAKKIKINKTTIFFYLPNNSKFHKDNLNKLENIKKIEDSIKEVTGKDFTISFFFENEGEGFVNLKSLSENVKKSPSVIVRETGSINEKPEQSIDLIKEQLSSQYSKIREKSEKADDFNKDLDTVESKSKEYDYFKKKFDIKEKKSGD